MTTPIRTKWHRILGLVDERRVYVTAPPGGIARRFEKLGGDLVTLRSFLNELEILPKFVIDPELAALGLEGEYHQSLLDMKRAEILRLPFPGLIVEVPWGANRPHMAVLLAETNRESKASFAWEDNLVEMGLKNEFPFYGISLRIHRDDEGEYLVVSPGPTFMDLKDDNGAPVIALMGSTASYLPNNATINQLGMETFPKTGADVFNAVASMLLLMGTGGVEKEVIECHKINKKRKTSGKHLVPTHTYIRIGHVYKSAQGTAKSNYISGSSPRPHWRRGHLWPQIPKEQWTRNYKPKFRQGRLVSYHPGEASPPAPQYKVIK